MKFLLIILFPFLLVAQNDVIITSTVYSAIAGRTEYHRMKDRALFGAGQHEECQEHSRIWHALEVPEVLSAFAVGGVIALDSFDEGKFKPAVMFSDLILTGAIRWMVYDGVYNISQGNNWFHQSKGTVSFLEPMGTPLTKIMVLAFALTFRFVIEEP